MASPTGIPAAWPHDRVPRPHRRRCGPDIC